MEKSQINTHLRPAAALMICSVIVLVSALSLFLKNDLFPRGSVAVAPQPSPEETETSPDETESNGGAAKKWQTIRSPDELTDRLKEGWQPAYLQLESVSDRYDLSVLDAVPQLEGLSFRGMRLTKNQLSVLPALPHLRILVFYDCRFEEGAIDSLPQLESLKSLSFMLSSLSDGDFEIVANRYGEEIEKLDLFCTRLTDAAAPHLAKFPMLRDLDLQGTMETNLSVQYLRGLKQLRHVRVRLHGPVSREDAERLRTSVSGVEVYWGS